MDAYLEFFGKPLAVAIAWVCTVVSCVYAFFQKKSRLKIKHNYEKLDISYKELEIKNFTLEQEIIEIKKTQIRDNQQKVIQNGGTNINQGILNGDFNFNN